MAQVNAGDEAKEIDLDAFDPSDLDAEYAPQVRLESGAGICPADIGHRAEVASHGVARQRGAERRHVADDRGHEAVAVWPRPDPVIAGVAVAIMLHRGF